MKVLEYTYPEYYKLTGHTFTASYNKIKKTQIDLCNTLYKNKLSTAYIFYSNIFKFERTLAHKVIKPRLQIPNNTDDRC